ncbi:lipid A-modifier LpxR family protein [Alteromonas macleodii]|uniref:lipid A-modifier LpxR family protein n=1 Tax=Alteromonas macleodii TaxID=28108 RepID=UPI002076A993|nr:lipid A-modifier LpxR family protein [Alteromonas macleodii]USI28548.1 lipid A deacylase LpxR family protein [Alteromonas macleodii]
MNYKWQGLFLVLSFLISFPSGGTEENRQQDAYFAVYFDNDVLLDVLGDTFGEDRNYTMGLGIIWAPKTPANNWFYPVHDSLTEKLGLGHHSQRSGQISELGFTRYKLTGTAFTPEDLSQFGVIEGDRPYSFLLNYGIEQTTVFATENSEIANYAEKTELSIGIWGLQVGEAVQTFIHQNISGSQIPNGWDNQISDGGEPSLFLRREQKWLVKPSVINSRWKWDIATTLDIGLGYQTYVQTGFDIRIGNTQIAEFYEHDFISLGSQTKILEEESNSPTGMYLYLGYRLTGNIYNVGLQGQFKRSAYEIDASDIKRFTHTYGLGIVAKPFSHFGIRFGFTWRSPEFDSSLYERTHGYGSLNLFWQY